MAIGVLRFGGILVPIVEEKNLTGDPVPISGTSSTLDFTDPLYDLWEQGENCAMEWVSAYTPTPEPDAIYTENFMPGGRTGLHGTAAELIVSKREQPDDGSTLDRNFFADWIIEDGGTEYDSGTFQYCSRTGALLSNTTRSRWFRFVALKFNWPDAADPTWQHYGYKVLACYKQEDTNTNTGSVSTSYASTGSCILNLPYINKARGVDLYIDEEEIEEEPFDPSEPVPYPPTPTRDDTSDYIGLPSSPTIGVSNAGFVHVYKPGVAALQNMGAYIFPNPTFPTDPTDIPGYLMALVLTLTNSRLIDYIIDCHLIPVTPTFGTSESIKVGGTTIPISVPVVTSDYVDVSCGNLYIPQWFNSFADFLATKSKIYLPFIGFVDLTPEYWQAGTIWVDYKFNVIDGSFMCYIRSTSSKSALRSSVIAQYSGNACMHFPMTGINYANMVSGVVGAAVAIESAKTPTQALGNIYSAANSILAGGDMKQSNGYNSTASILGVRTPYILIERADPAYPTNYKHDKGYPSNITRPLSGISGFTTIEDIDLTGVPLTQVEIDELRGLLKEGVYF